MPRSGVSSPDRHVDIAPAPETASASAVATPAGGTPPAPLAVLRLPAIRLNTLYRVAQISHARGLLADTKFRLLQFLSRQRLDPMTGRVEGRWGTDEIDGGLTLAERYACVHAVGEDRFWDDLRGVYAAGFAEQVVRPAPGRRAVYALCLREDAIPHDLPEDLTRELRVWDLPAAVDPDEDAAYGRLTSRQAPPVEPLVMVCENAATRQLAAELAAAPRWEHPAGSKAAQVAGTIRESAKRLPVPPDLRCTAVADHDKTAEMTARVEQLLARSTYGKASPLYARGFSQLVGFSSTGSSGLGPPFRMEQTKTTPSAAPGPSTRPGPFGEDPAVVATRVQRRVWHLWRAQLGYSEVFLPSRGPEDRGRSVTGDAWSDLHRTIMIALRRGGTESQLVELLSSNVIRYDQWGALTFKATNMGRLAGWRLWRFINAQGNSPGYRKIPTVRQADHVTWRDNATTEEREAARLRALEEGRRRDAAIRADLNARWRLDQVEETPDQLPPADELSPAAEARRNIRVRRPQIEPDGERTRSWAYTPQSSTARRDAALAKARAEKRARRRGGQQ